MTIINPLPYTFVINTVIDPTQVNADFAQIVNSTNTNAAHNGANSDITSLSGLTTPLSVAQGGTGSATAPGALTSLGAVAKAGDTMSGALTISAAGYGLTVGNSILVGQASQFNSNLTVLGALTVNSGGTLTSNTINTATLNSCTMNSSNLNGCALVACAASSSLSVSGGLTVTSGLDVASGDFIVAGGNAAIAGIVTINGGGTALNVTSGNLAVAGVITVVGNLSASSALIVGGDISSGANMFAAGSLTVNADVVAAGTVQAGASFVSVTDNTFKPSGGTWIASSDSRIKKAIAPYTRGLAAVLNLAPVTYQHNGKGGTVDDGKTYIGLVADDVRTVMPEMVGVRTDKKLDPADDHETEILTLDATALIYALTNSVKELSARVAALEGKQA